jgi:hypothetical protein
MFGAFILCLCCVVCRLRPCNDLITRPRSPTGCEKRKKDYGTEQEARALNGLEKPMKENVIQ